MCIQLAAARGAKKCGITEVTFVDHQLTPVVRLLSPEGCDKLLKVEICGCNSTQKFPEATTLMNPMFQSLLDSDADVITGQIDERHHDNIIALRTLKGVGQRGTQGADKLSVSITALDSASRSKYIKQIIQLSVQWPDTAFHEHIYRMLMELGLENELSEYGGSDLVAFLQSAGRKHQEEVRGVSAVASKGSKLHDLGAPISTIQTKYIELLARYYVLKGEHIAAARLLLILAERQCSSVEEAPTLDQRYQYLSNAVLQAKSAGIAADSSRNPIDSSSTVDLLEGKRAVLRFQMQIKQELEYMVSRLENIPGSAESLSDPFTRDNILADAETAKAAKDKAKELSLNLKRITQLYNDYAVPFNLWEVCLEMLNFANYSGEADSKIVREIWARLLDQALTRGGVAEACSVVKRVGSKLDPADGACLPMDIICFHFEKAALDRLSSGEELVGDEDVARALLGACKGLPEPVLAVYDQLLSNGVIVPSLYLKLQPYRATAFGLKQALKLTSKFYGPFQVMQKMGKVAYKLQVPDGVGIHSVFHVSQLKRHCGSNAVPSPDLPLVTKEGKIKTELAAVLETRTLPHHDKLVTQWLIQWVNLPLEVASWEDADFIKGTFLISIPIPSGHGFLKSILEGKYAAEERAMSEPAIAEGLKKTPKSEENTSLVSDQLRWTAKM